ncbi:MAG: hypothetical protein HY359_16575, partial [Candidatus Rokubacteria bacterium]|nr:hypothetical protein [Candidatus Rokubacteria bacterium]
MTRMRLQFTGLLVLLTLALGASGTSGQTGSLTIGLAAEPNTLDPHLSG